MSEQFDERREIITQLEANLQAANEQNAKLQSENDKLTKEYNELDAINIALYDKYRQLEKQLDEHSQAYDRMNPELNELIERLEVYSKITYGIEAYELSNAEARLLVKQLKAQSDTI